MRDAFHENNTQRKARGSEGKERKFVELACAMSRLVPVVFVPDWHKNNNPIFALVSTSLDK